LNRREFHSSQADIGRVLEDSAASYWLKDALISALSRDPVDAANDAEVLCDLLQRWCLELLEPYDPDESSALNRPSGSQ
jgi:hypothetical protein